MRTGAALTALHAPAPLGQEPARGRVAGEVEGEDTFVVDTGAHQWAAEQALQYATVRSVA